jgi:superoxide dismutase, Fe-Mn family
MATFLSRRSFLASGTKTAAAITLAGLSGGELLAGCATVKSGFGTLATGFDQTPLPYAYADLEPVIDALTMEIHYSKHAGAYAANLKDAAKAEGVDFNEPLETVLQNISKYSAKLRNNGGGHYNHELFWKSMCKGGSILETGKLRSALEQSFGSFEAFQSQLSDAGKNRFGSGWAWLYADADKKLKIGSTPNQDNPLMDVSDIKGTPLLGIDVWEHAYYLKYQNKRADYITNWWKVVNWNFVQQRYSALV